MRSYEWALIQYDWCPSKKKLGHRHAQREDHVKMQKTDGHLQAKEALKKPALRHLDLGLSVCRTVRKSISAV